MSGPKDYEFVFTAARLAEIESRRAREHEARQSRTLARLQARRQQAIAAARKATARRLAIAHELAAQRKAVKKSEDLQQAREQLTTQSTESRPKDDHSPASIRPAAMVNDSEPQLAQDQKRSPGAGGDGKATESLIADIAQWQNELAQDEEVLAYQGHEAQNWATRAKQFMSEFESGDSSAGEQTAQRLILDARQIHAQAGELRGQFATRNELLRDVVSSLEEIGFFVADPYFENADNPAGAVIVRATRGSETMTASIDLSDTIKSVWDGIPDETCKEAFFDYVEGMARKGVKIEPLRADLHSRPALLRKGAKDLPTDGRNRERQA